MELEEDHLSCLPKIILHCILSKLPEKERTRTSVLSKAWLDTWYTFPILYFHSNQIIGMSPPPMEDSVRKRKILEFGDYVKRRMLMFRDQSLAIKKFRLNLNGFVVRYMSKDVDNWLKLACECGVEVIQYSQQILEGQEQYHVLPISVIEAKSLTKLVLQGNIKIDPVFMNYSIKFFSLRELSLTRVLFGDEHAINQLISFCPLIEYITLDLCEVLSSGGGTRYMEYVSISGLQNLKSVDVSAIQDVSIDASSLENFCYNTKNYGAPSKIDFDRCRNLKELYLWSVESTSTNKWFLELFPKFPFLESLKLNNCKMPKKIDISSVRLKRLEFMHSSNLKELNIDSPNLISFGYSGWGASEPTISFLKNSSQLEARIHIAVEYKDLCNLREFVQNIKPNNVLPSLSVAIAESYVDALGLVVSSPPPNIKKLVMQGSGIWGYERHLFLFLVNILLSSCCPETVSFRFDLFKFSKTFIEVCHCLF
ncbi:putative F-box domain, leucine-rich repeat domain, L domain-containing protein [Medicago truncatula]|uniref:Putative F-box domain, leucine-rich repeat domain, L domain-containing protein n=1 Tax=Medicago truncatula TaxID=3880 RepID=A0A396HDC0_MEDTR|nr:putative F-box domain, leucine-rich repeat domain, L domain-containing protein [Medicago truncatula]